MSSPRTIRELLHDLLQYNIDTPVKIQTGPEGMGTPVGISQTWGIDEDQPEYVEILLCPDRELFGKEDLREGATIQIDPAHDPAFGRCMMIVSEVAHWGVKCYMEVPNKGTAHYRVPLGSFHVVGPAHWMSE